MSVLRAFIAVELPATIQEAISKQTIHLRQALGDHLIRWIPPQNIHLTLKFFGDIDSSHVDFIKQMLHRELDSLPEFEFQLGGLGVFPNSKRPRVIWIGIHTSAPLILLHRKIDEGSARLGYKNEGRPFSPHLTLGRVKQGLPTGELQKMGPVIETMQLGNIATTRVDAVHLFKSDLQPAGAVYSKLFTQQLKPL